ncbi:MAG: lamin tail domain-containing protein, partial [Caldilineaceae bacterium]|nr:lamin tail domain-containing protein [Caldilineaceae bacterium]
MNRRVPILVATIAMVVALAGAAWSTALAATPTELFFSEYIEGSSNNKALEIYNGTGATIDLAAGGYNVQMYFNGSASASLTINLTGVVAPGDVFVLAQSSANATILAQADQTNGAGWFNGDDAVVLRKGTTVIDAIGQIGFDPGSEWGSGLTSTADNTLRRKATICAGDPNGSDVFDPSVEWEGFATDTFDGLGSHTAACAGPDAAPAVISTYPVVGAMDFPFRDNLTVTFSEPVNADPATFTLTCGSDELDFTVSGGPETFTIDPEGDLPTGTSCTLTILAANVTDLDTNDPPDTMDADAAVMFTPFDVCLAVFTPIYAIQGSGAAAAITGAVTTQGVVVGDYEGASPALRGFYMQDAAGDGNSATSDAIFVFNGNNNNVNLGDVVRVTGTAGEFQDQTQISSVSAIANCGAGSVQPVDVTLPTAAADTLEQYEGMLVRFPQTLYVTEHFQLGRFGQVVVTSQPDRQRVGTHVAAPGAPALAVEAANRLDRIIIDDALNNQTPDPISFGRNGQPLSASNTLRGGDAVTGAVGIMTYTWAGNSASGNAYRLRP